MTSTKTATTRPRVDERIAKALSHPLRQRILASLNDSGVASPNELATKLGEPLGNVSYHMRILKQRDCVELVRTEPRRGAIEHYYRATVRPFFEDEQWAKLPLSVRRQLFGQNLEDIWTDVRAAAEGSGFDDPEAHVSRTQLELDDEAWSDLAGRMAALLDDALRLHAESAGRAIEGSGEGRRKAELSMLLFDRAEPQPAGRKRAAGRRRKKA
jgi:DNA-binding transcriptional ArsR family regulator